MAKKKLFFAVQSPSKKRFYINTLPPLGLLYTASFLESKDIQVDVADFNVDKREIEDFDLSGYDAVGFSVHNANIERSFAAIDYVKREYKKPVIVGGALTQTEPHFLARHPNVDVVLGREGEHAMHEYFSQADTGKVRGLYVKDANGDVIYTGTRQWEFALDDLPFPALDKVDIRKYNVPLKKQKPISSMITSRGCPYKCVFCQRNSGDLWRPRSAENVFKEMKWQVEEIGVREICIFDDNFTMDLARAKKICDMLIKEKLDLKLQFTNGIRADRLDRELVHKLKLAGWWLAGIAPEVGSEESIKKVKKGFTLEQVEQAAKWFKEEGIFVHSYFMFGFPWETRKDIEDTIAFANKLDTEIVQFCRVTPYKSTELYTMVQDLMRRGELKDQGNFYGGLLYEHPHIQPEELRVLVKKAYRSCYLKPWKMWKIFNNLSLKDMYSLVKYSIVTDSM